MNKNSDSLNFYKENGADEVKNVTSDMYEVISTGTPINLTKSSPQKAPTNAPRKKAQTKKTTAASNKNKSAMPERISESAKGNKAPQSKKQAPKQRAEKKKSAPKSRKPKGKDMRNVPEKDRPISESAKALDQQKQRKTAEKKAVNNKKKLNKSEEKYRESLRQGKSHDEISKGRAKNKRKKRKLAALLTTLTVMLFVFGVAGWYAYNNGAILQTIKLEGETVYSKKQITETANIYKGLNMLSIRESKVNEVLTQTYPYIHSAEIKRTLPDTLTITVTPTKETLLIKNGSDFFCVDDYDKILLLKKKKLSEGMYRIDGLEKQEIELCATFVPSEENAERYETAKRIISALKENGSFKKGILNVKDLTDITFTYDSRVRLYLGDGGEIESQLSLGAETMLKGVAEGQKAYIDLRYSNKAYLYVGSMEAK